MISNLDPLVATHSELPFVRPTGDEFQIGDFLIRRFSDDKFLIFNHDLEMMETDAGKLESALRDFFHEEF